MNPIISENHTVSYVNIRKIVERFIRYQKLETLKDLNEISIVNNTAQDNAFACYKKAERKIEIYLKPTLGWQPWILKKTYFFPFLVITMALAHEIDHHVNRNNDFIDKERSAEDNLLKYMYPTLGIFKPIVKLINIFLRKRKRTG